MNQANHLANPFAPTSPLAASVVEDWERTLPLTNLADIRTKRERNDLVYKLIFISDYRFNRYEADLMLGKATRDIFIDLSTFGLNAATALIEPGMASQILAAIAGGLTFSRNTIEKNFYMNHTAPVLMARMRALRKEKLNEIVRNLSKSWSDYPPSLAIIDVLDYYNRGTMLGALQSISDDTATKEIKASGGEVTPPPQAPAVTTQIKNGTVAGQQSHTLPLKPVTESSVPPNFSADQPVALEAKAQDINNTIITKAASIDQLNRFCQAAELPPPIVPATGTDAEKFEAAKESVMKQVLEIKDSQQIQKAAGAAATVFGTQTPNH